ncbi:DUF4242 domain-containing protein [Mycobacterium sp. MAA66]|uniref:DUF4242 domain-containing protein n=1 Tax=Mycobacterium sp. MAA66 TaxID=3156297 RepID=UPI003519649F
MTLYLYEIAGLPGRAEVDQAIKTLDAEVHRAGGELIEAQVTGQHRVFVVAAFADGGAAQIDAASVAAAELTGPHEVRLVGADLDQLKAVRPTAGYLVEWDLPADLDMDSYLSRKKANAPKYAQVPEVSFLRTYVRVDMDKCLCLYDAPDEDAVRRARVAVQTPVDRLYGLESGGQ